MKSAQQCQISFRVSPTEAEIIKNAARASGRQQRDWLRHAVLSAVDVEQRGVRSLEEKVELLLLHTTFLREIVMQRAKGAVPDDSGEHLAWCRQLQRRVEDSLIERHYLRTRGDAR